MRTSLALKKHKVNVGDLGWVFGNISDDAADKTNVWRDMQYIGLQNSYEYAKLMSLITLEVISSDNLKMRIVDFADMLQ
jgi:hypothetical protein